MTDPDETHDTKDKKKSYDWFKSWHGAPTDIKYMVIARKAGSTPGVVSAVMWALLDRASSSSTRGSIEGFDIETYCAFTGFEEPEVQNIIKELHVKGVLKDDVFEHWDDRQSQNQDSSAERTRRYREKLKLQTENEQLKSQLMELQTTVNQLKSSMQPYSHGTDDEKSDVDVTQCDACDGDVTACDSSDGGDAREEERRGDKNKREREEREGPPPPAAPPDLVLRAYQEIYARFPTPADREIAVELTQHHSAHQLIEQLGQLQGSLSTKESRYPMSALKAHMRQQASPSELQLMDSGTQQLFDQARLFYETADGKWVNEKKQSQALLELIDMASRDSLAPDEFLQQILTEHLAQRPHDDWLKSRAFTPVITRGQYENLRSKILGLNPAIEKAMHQHHDSEKQRRRQIALEQARARNHDDRLRGSA